jgi:hypothetical protein
MTIRPPAVAGSFYPADPAELAALVDHHVAAGQAQLRAGVGDPRAIIAPHAGYVYSGPIAGTAYAAVAERRAPIATVVLLGPAHRVRVDGLAASSADAFATPLGAVAVDRSTMDRLLRRRLVAVVDAAHVAEHSLEVQLPFLQRVIGRFTLVPLAVGNASHAAVAALLDDLDDGTLIVVSSDLSHYYDYDTARRLDEATARAIELLQPEQLGSESACGRIPVGGLLLFAQRRRLRPTRLDLRNSGDTAGPRDQVVGYGAFAFS